MTAKSAKKRPRSLALRGGKTAILMASNSLDGWRSLQYGQEARAFFSGASSTNMLISLFPCH
jgi:hypothetical protein